ncbi:histone-lysine N-methyltransferase SETDB2 isoform X1 [Synchiropus splendidus]|uniref:histone-lysine N-methyltransferase SETDB2 isoform X1 n=1 Tax=Synchiropus splendidus TaxID=270530 RepID=UPI00237D97A6|nr:histone-lysine N-methyltransferase SETDB2 isoform X1 [Synchiropus splendidus]
MEEGRLNAEAVERARSFWAGEDVDRVFSALLVSLEHLRTSLKSGEASDKELVQSLKLLDCLNWTTINPSTQQVVQVVVGSDLPENTGNHVRSTLLSHSAPHTPVPEEDISRTAPSADPAQLLSLLEYKPHTCTQSCIPSLPKMHQYPPPFWTQNPLKVPLLCGFLRVNAALMERGVEGSDNDADIRPSEKEESILYVSPCGKSLLNYDEVMRFLLDTSSYDIMQVDFFCFNAEVHLDSSITPVPRRPELDLSRGLEPTPVDLCMGPENARPPDFRYRKERWPHGCFLSHSSLFKACCDCTDGCSDAQLCACVAMTNGGNHYSHQRLRKPISTGIFECGPWCGCDRTRCQNRVVQRGIRVRLQVFQTERHGWGVRCLDDLDEGTFLCIYAGLMMRKIQVPTELPPPKLTRADLPSDDEVEVVTEWLAPPLLEGRCNVLDMAEPCSKPLHVPVIQGPTDTVSGLDSDVIETVVVGAPPSLLQVAGHEEVQTKKVAVVKGGVNGRRSLKRRQTSDNGYVLDASREGNVSRFFNHSCEPNMFTQSVFTDSHDPGFPIIAFFTSRVVKAGTELTWNYSVCPLLPTLDVPCCCNSNNCCGHFTIEEKHGGTFEGNASGVIKSL